MIACTDQIFALPNNTAGPITCSNHDWWLLYSYSTHNAHKLSFDWWLTCIKYYDMDGRICFVFSTTNWNCMMHMSSVLNINLSYLGQNMLLKWLVIWSRLPTQFLAIQGRGVYDKMQLYAAAFKMRKNLNTNTFPQSNSVKTADGH